MKKIILLISIIVFSVALAEKVEKIELKNLDGDWEGVGEFLVPVTNMNVDISGSANFAYNEKSKKLRTSLFGEKLFFTYSDSGYLWVDPKSDTISWEVWDNRGKHALYHGKLDGNTITGERKRKDEIYRVIIEQVTTDSIDFKLNVTQPDGGSFNKAVFHLWRVKEN